MKKEIEVKIELSKEEFDTLSPSSVLPEITYGYFKQDMSNIKDGVFPRIKHIDGQDALLTVKLKTTVNDRYFEREEIEMMISAGQVAPMRDILKSLGFMREISFEKKRAVVQKPDAMICFDILPFGYFMEIEGEPDVIEKYIQQYKLTGKSRINRAYLGLWEDYKKSHSITEENCLFK